MKYLTPVGGEALSTAQAELTRLQNMKHDPRPLGARLDGLKGVLNRSYKRIDKMEADRAALDLRWMREHLRTQMAEIELPDPFEDPQPWLQLIGRPQWKSMLKEIVDRELKDLPAPPPSKQTAEFNEAGRLERVHGLFPCPHCPRNAVQVFATAKALTQHRVQ